MLSKNLAIVVNGNSRIGNGHLYRCLSIAKEKVFDSFHIMFLVPEDCNTDLLLKPGYNVVAIDINSQGAILQHLFENSIDIVLIDLVLDDYKKLFFLKKYRDKLFISTVTLFDFEDQIRFEHLSFFPDFENDNEIWLHNTGTLKCMGKSYIVLNGTHGESIEESGDVIIAMGGGDQYGLTLKAVKALRMLNYDCLVLINSNHKDYDEITAIINEVDNIRVANHVESFIHLISKFKLIILNGGLTRYEAVYALTPFLAISIHTQQYNITEKLTRYGVGINLGIVDSLTSNYISLKVNDLLANSCKIEEMKSRMIGLISDRGSFNIASRIIDNYNKFIDEKAI